MFNFERYSSDKKSAWDEFVRSSKNATFLHYRDYMDYHADRFTDHSYLITNQKDELIALFPASIKDDIVSTHGGLSFGGFLTNARMTTPVMCGITEQLIAELKNNSVQQLHYKTIPSIYHKSPAEEDRYAFFLQNAGLYRRDVLSVIDLANPLPRQERRMRSLKKAQKANLQVRETQNFTAFWHVLETVLATRHGVKPVHTVPEIQLLQSRFPDNIKLYGCYDKDTMIAGTVMYLSQPVAHAQYIACHPEFNTIGALDLVFDHAIQNCADYHYFDFGISNEQNGRVLNEGLIEFKEGFGARAIMHDFYSLALTK